MRTRIPVDVVVDKASRSPEGSGLGDAIRCNEQVEFALGLKFFRIAFGVRRECRQDGGEIFAQVGERCPVTARPGHQCRECRSS